MFTFMIIACNGTTALVKTKKKLEDRVVNVQKLLLIASAQFTNCN